MSWTVWSLLESTRCCASLGRLIPEFKFGTHAANKAANTMNVINGHIAITSD